MVLSKVQAAVKALRQSPVLLGLLFVMLINVGFTLSNPVSHVDPQSLPAARGWCWWAAHDYLAEAQAPDVVIVGSSLMMNPIWENEADFLNKDVDIAQNRRCEYLGHAINEHLKGAPIVSFNMALPGGMLSDDYMVTRTLLTGAHKPKILVMGLSPRDFIDSAFKFPASSDHYRYLKRFLKNDDLTELAMPEIWQRLSYYLHNTAYLDAKKADLQVIVGELSKKLLLPANQTKTASKKTDTEARLAIYQSEMKQGEWIAHPHCQDYYHETELDKLQKRYSHPNFSTYRNQKKWLDLTLELCKQEGIQPIIFNVPVTDKNVHMFPPGVYQTCVDSFAAEAQKYDCPFFDLQKKKNFVITDFTDFCHMDASGGKKLLDHIAEAIGQNDRMALALKSGGASIADSGQQVPQ